MSTRYRYLFLSAAFALAGCATDGQGVSPYKAPPVYIPVPTPCKDVAGPAPHYPDTEEALNSAPNSVAWAKLIVTGRRVRILREAVLVAALAACATAPAGGGTGGAGTTPPL